jgi:hypothetical protein
MLLHFSPRDWFFIFLALLLCSYVKLASAKTQKNFQGAAPAYKALTLLRF